MKRNFLDLFDGSKKQLEAKLDVSSKEKPAIIHIKNKLITQVGRRSREYIDSICKHEKLQEFASFYNKYDGFYLAKDTAPIKFLGAPLFRQFSGKNIAGFTKLYLPGERYSWTIDLNKSQSLYRVPEAWIAFARIERGPSCLTMFLEGENAGNIYFLEPQPHFNILNPIAKSYNALLERIEKDPAAFLKLVGANVSVEKDGMHLGYVPTRYVDKFSSAD